MLGLVLFFNPHTLTGPIHLGSAPTWPRLVFALTVAVIAFTSLESASGLAGEVRISRAGLKRLVGSTTATVAFLYVGIALVAVTALPVHDGHTELAGRYLNAPMIGVVSHVHPHWLGKDADVPRRGHGRGDARRGRQLGDARPLAAGVLAVDQPPDPQRPRAPAPRALDAVRADHPRGRDRRGARGDARTSTSSSASTRSARRSRSRSRTCRSAACATPSPTRDRPYRVPLSVTFERRAAAAAGRVRRAGLGRRARGGAGRAPGRRATSASAGWPWGSRCT